MVDLLILTCNSDILVTRLLFIRLKELDAWKCFTSLHIYLDSDISMEEFNLILRPHIPFRDDHIHIHYNDIFNAWNSCNIRTALNLYHEVSKYGVDFLKIDTDIYPVSINFFKTIIQAGCDGYGGRVMPFFRNASMNNHPFYFVQGGVTYFGKNAREYLIKLNDFDLVINEIREAWVSIEFHDENNPTLYKKYFTEIEDVVIFGVLASLHNIPIHNINCIQLSPYDIVKDFQNQNLRPSSIIELFKQTEALAYHFEGNQWGNRIFMNKVLKWLYFSSGYERKKDFILS